MSLVISENKNENLRHEKISWHVLSSYFKENYLSSAHINTYNDFLNFGMQEIVDQEPPVIVNDYKFKLGTVSVGYPCLIEHDRNVYKMYPADARKRDLTYDAPIYIDIIEECLNNKTNKIEINLKPKVAVGRLPTMLYGQNCNLANLRKEEKILKGECENDYGGYFILKGNERILVSQIRNIYNQSFILDKKQEKYSYINEIRSMSNETGHSVLIKALLSNDDRTLYFSLPCIKEPIYVGIVFKALGYQDDDIVSFIAINDEKGNKYIRHILRDSSTFDKDESIEYIGKRSLKPTENKYNYGKQIVESELFPHIGISGSNLQIGLMLGKLIKKLIQTRLGYRNYDDRDNFANKRVETSGVLLTDLFRNLIKKYMESIKTALQNKKQHPDILHIILKNRIISKGFHQCISTGNWNIQKNATYVKTGVAQLLDRMTYCATLSHLKRVVITSGKETKKLDMRQIHQTSFGFICPCESPEGKKIGAVLNFALLSEVTPRLQQTLIKEIIENFKDLIPIKSYDKKYCRDYIYVYLNGNLIGFVFDHENIVNKIKKYKKKGILHHQISVTYDEINEEIKIFSEEGRFTRPFFTLDSEGNLNILKEKNIFSLGWKDLLEKGYVCYLDSSEIETSVIAMYPYYTKFYRCDYCEINPIVVLGLMSGLIPFPDHSQSPRNAYQAGMGKQALGIPLYNYNLRTDTMLYVLHYPQKPIVNTKVSYFIGTDEMPSGINCIVAVGCYTGYNQEDSAMINYSSVEKGLFCLTSYHTLDCCEKKRDSNGNDEICMPPENSHKDVKNDDEKYFRRKNANYSLLDSNGIVKSRTEKGASIIVKPGDVLVGKIITKTSKTGKIQIIDDSLVVQSGDEGIIDRVYVTITPNGYKLVKIVLRVIRTPELGDKLASRSSQKGTIGMMYNQEDMPFSDKGIIPDIVINPLAFPGRMTINQIIETILGKQACFVGKCQDSTPFTENSQNIAETSVEDFEKAIKGYGYNSKGWENMRCGMTGRLIKSKIYMGPTYYQRLKHMVVDKMHARAKGQVTQLTRQPVEGRAKDGGLRFGEMERDSMIAHGASSFLKERLFQVSDAFRIPICKNCGIITINNNECQSCGKDSVVVCNIPYASKLLIQELATVGLKMKLIPSIK
jgi:DNA-directed RNA polymerase II subunit RPB2